MPVTGGLTGGKEGGAVPAAAEAPNLDGVARGPTPESSTAEFQARTPDTPGSSVIEEEDDDEAQAGIQPMGADTDTDTDTQSTQSAQNSRGLATAPADAPETGETETEASAVHDLNMRVLLVASLALLVCSVVVQS